MMNRVSTLEDSNTKESPKNYRRSELLEKDKFNLSYSSRTYINEKEKTIIYNNNEILTRLQQMRQDGVATDVNIICHDKIFRVHKLILAAICQYFEELFVYDECKTIIIYDLNPDVIETFLTLLYTGNADVSNITTAQTKELVYIGHTVIFPNFKQLLFEHLLLSINVENFGSALLLAKSLHSNKHVHSIINFMAQNLSQIWHHHDFVSITEEDLLDVLLEAMPLLSCHNIFREAVIEWIEEHSPRERPMKEDLFCPYINESSSIEQLDITTLANTSFITKCDDLSEMMQRNDDTAAKQKVDVKTTTEPEFPEKECTESSNIVNVTATVQDTVRDTVLQEHPIFVLVRQDDTNKACIVTYNINEGYWSSLEDMPLQLHTRPGVGYYQGKIFFLGGIDVNGCKLRNCYAYDICSKSAIELIGFRIARSEAIVFGANNNIYIAGGLGRYSSNGLSQMEYLEIANAETWKIAPRMHKHRNENVGSCQIGKKVYIMGGGSQVCEYYDAIKNQWIIIDLLLSPVKPHKLLILDTITNNWSQYVPKNEPPDTILSSVGHGSNIYVLDKMKNIIALNTKTGFWSLVTKIPKKIAHPVFLTCVNDILM